MSQKYDILYKWKIIYYDFQEKSKTMSKQSWNIFHARYILVR